MKELGYRPDNVEYLY
jgi:hypothetical protein